MKLTTKYLLALITTLLLLNLSVAEALKPSRASGMGSLAYIGPEGPPGPQGAAAGATASCTPLYIGGPGPDSGIVAYVDGSGCHGLEAQTFDLGASSSAPRGVQIPLDTALTMAASYNTTTTNTVARYSCTTASNVLLRPYCWHLPSQNELKQLVQQFSAVGNLNSFGIYWTSSGLPDTPPHNPEPRFFAIDFHDPQAAAYVPYPSTNQTPNLGRAVRVF